jgi:uncharacterized protein YndB with AHSA1/START domain
VEQRIAAAPATVFSYLVDPVKFVQWMGVEASIDPQAGGEFRLRVDGEHTAVGRYRDVEPPHRLVMTWGWEGRADLPPGSSIVEVTLEADGSGTLLRLRHSGLPTREERISHREGWRLYTGRLAGLFNPL